LPITLFNTDKIAVVIFFETVRAKALRVDIEVPDVVQVLWQNENGERILDGEPVVEVVASVVIDRNGE